MAMSAQAFSNVVGKEKIGSHTELKVAKSNALI